MSGAKFGDGRVKASIWVRLVRDEKSGCWLWKGSSGRGYGLVYVTRSKRRVVHRVVYEALVGNVDADRQLDHLCRNRACANPDHLEPVSARENLARGKTLAARNAKKTHCPKGHEYTPHNTLRYDGKRSCRECGRERCRAYGRKRKRRRGAS